MRRTSRGRQKIEMAKIENENHLQVTFSKRRAGAFKKASELNTLTGADVGLVVFSPANRVYSFGHPNVESLADRYLSGNPPMQSHSDQFVEEYRNANQCGLNLQLANVENQLEAAKKYSKTLDQVLEADRTQFGWSTQMDDQNLEQLQQLKDKMEKLQINVQMCVEEKRAQFTMELANNPLPYQAAIAPNPLPYQAPIAPNPLPTYQPATTPDLFPYQPATASTPSPAYQPAPANNALTYQSVGPNYSEAVMPFDPNACAFDNSVMGAGFDHGNGGGLF